MQKYEKEYEDVLKITDEERKRAAITNVAFPKGVTDVMMQEYINRYAHEKTVLDVLLYLRVKWLNDVFIRARVGYDQRRIICKSNRRVMAAKAGHNMQFYFLNGPRWLNRYIEDWYPGWKKGDPFARPEDFPYPYDHVTMEFLFVVHQLTQRADLLAEAERTKMPYIDFVNYVINFVKCEDDRTGMNQYEVKKQYQQINIYIKNKRLK